MDIAPFRMKAVDGLSERYGNFRGNKPEIMGYGCQNK